MMREPERTELHQHSAVRNYLAVCLVALVVMWLALLERGLGWYSLLPVLVGSLTLVARWQLGPVLLLIILAGMLHVLSLRPLGYFVLGRSSSIVADALLCAAVLAYVVSNYRLQALLHHILPPDARVAAALKERRRLRKKSAASMSLAWSLPDLARQRRSPRLVTRREISVLLFSLPVWTALALIGWNQLDLQNAELDFPTEAWHGMILLWLVGIGLVVASGLFGYLDWMRWTRDEATMALQDMLWRETRREQGRLNRWLAWSRDRKERRGGA